VSLAARLEALGLTLPAVATPLGTYVPARVAGSLVYTSGQLPMADGVLVDQGTVADSDGVSPERAAECATTAVLNAVAAAADAVGDLAALQGVVSVTGYVAAAPGFENLPAILNPASALLGEIFGDHGRHARAVVGVAALPFGAPVEVAVVFETDVR